MLKTAEKIEITEKEEKPPLISKKVKLPIIVTAMLIVLASISPWPIAAAERAAEEINKTNEQETIVELNFYFSNPYLTMQKQDQVLGVNIGSNELDRKLIEIENFYKNLDRKHTEILKRKTQTTSLVAFLRKQGSPVATYDYANQIIEVSEKNGADYKILVALMGVESGFCNANYKTYNCFGFLNGVQYSSYSNAFNSLIPQIANRYVKQYGTNFEGLAAAYGIQNVAYHAPRLRAYYNAI
jgi:hypothetical protein